LRVARQKGGWGRCTTCAHNDRPAIEEAVVGGVSIAQVAKQFGLSSSALQRHMDRHGHTSLVKITPAGAIATGDSTADELEALLQEAKARLANAGSSTQALDAIDKALKVVIARGAWQEREILRRPAATVNLLTTQEWLETRGLFVKGLEAHDLKYHGHDHASSARLAVDTALKEDPIV